jgi:nucleotide-binding universal stress UspA family protein
MQAAAMADVHRILLATDFSPGSARARAFASMLARRLGAELVVAHVSEPLAIVPGSDLAAEEVAQTERELDRVVGELKREGVAARGTVVPGEPATEIVALAEREHADLIVLGTHGRSGLAHVLLGSVAERVLRRARCPVLAVPHEGRAEAAETASRR